MKDELEELACQIPNAATRSAMRDVVTGTGLSSFDSIEALIADLNSDKPSLER